jgi:hypothetical protein
MAERALLQDGRRKNRQGLIALALLLACSAPKEYAKIRGDYQARHPELTPAEISRLQFRTGIAGDTLERLQVAWVGCEFEQSMEEGFTSVYIVAVPTDGQKIRIGEGTAPEYVYAGGHVMVTFDHKKMLRWSIMDSGMHLP